MKVAVILFACLSAAYGYNILCIQSLPSKSHYHLMKGLVQPLLEAGHQVTWVTTFPDTKPVKNLKYVDVSHIQEIVNNVDMTNRRLQGMTMVKQFAWNISRSAIQDKGVREVLTNENFDAVISEWFFADVDAGYAAVQQVPWILLSGIILHAHIEEMVDVVRSVPVVPAIMNDYEIPMNFWQRVMNTISYVYATGHTLLDYSTVKANYETYFGPIAKARGISLPPFSEAVHNVSILFLNSHPSFAPAQVTAPNVVDIAGYHIDEDVPPLPQDLQDLLDSSPQGVVYFSMGSVLKSSALPDHTKKALIQVFKELPYTVLWKFEEKLEGLPKSLHIRTWMPQSSILSHPNVKVFITHGGLLSTLESIHFGVPVIAVPVFGDQPSNALRSVRAGHALKVDFSPDMAGDLKLALNEMLSNNRYYERAKSLSKLFRNRPVSSRKLIQHYVELAIESKGAFHLRSKSRLYSWYQLWMLDQLALLALIVYVVVAILKKIANLFKKKQKVAKGKKEKKN